MKRIIFSVVLFYTYFLSINLHAGESQAKKNFDNLIPAYIVTINNKPYKFVLQTGYSETIIDKALAQQLGGGNHKTEGLSATP